MIVYLFIGCIIYVSDCFFES